MVARALRKISGVIDVGLNTLFFFSSFISHWKLTRNLLKSLLLVRVESI
jgi:hypothetical protein